jgi:hypothetical protein
MKSTILSAPSFLDVLLVLHEQDDLQPLGETCSILAGQNFLCRTSRRAGEQALRQMASCFEGVSAQMLAPLARAGLGSYYWAFAWQVMVQHYDLHPLVEKLFATWQENDLYFPPGRLATIVSDETSWSPATVKAVASRVSQALCDLGAFKPAMDAPGHILVPGQANKLWLTPSMATLVTRWLTEQGILGLRAIEHPIWQAIFARVEDRERALMDAHQWGLITYEAAGSTIIIRFAGTVNDTARSVIDYHARQ